VKLIALVVEMDTETRYITIIIILLVLIVILLVFFKWYNQRVPENRRPTRVPRNYAEEFELNADYGTKRYLCPDCSAEVSIYDNACPQCATVFEDRKFRCPSCSTQVLPSQVKCYKCGEELEADPFVCPYCEDILSPTAKYCPGCKENFWSPVRKRLA
jgi:DNA-directed RNA polymerase subunit RPC12/RpoP